MSAATIDELLLGDEPQAWSALGFDVSDEHCLLGEVCLRFLGADAASDATAAREAAAVQHTSATPATHGILGWSLRGVRDTLLDGLPTTTSTRAARAAAPAHPNGVLAIDHIVAMSPVLDRSVLALQAAGLDLRRVREEPTPAGAPRQAFFRLGREILELVQEPDSVVAAADDSTRPAHFWGLALRVADIEHTSEFFAPHISPIRPAVQAGRQIATLRRSAGLGVPVALITPPPTDGDD